MPESYDKRAIVSGAIIEVYKYGVPVRRLAQDERKESAGGSGKGRGAEADQATQIENRMKVLRRASQLCRRVINTNATGNDKFLTLTFAENIKDIRQANYEFKKFRQRLEYEAGKHLEYVCVPEFQKRGAVHYHLVLFGFGFMGADKLAAIWQNGFIKINAIDNVDNLGAYVTKYMTKDCISKKDSLKGEKCFFRSRGLKEPLEVIGEGVGLIEELYRGEVVYQAVFDTDFRGEVEYKQINLNRGGEKNTLA